MKKNALLAMALSSLFATSICFAEPYTDDMANAAEQINSTDNNAMGSMQSPDMTSPSNPGDALAPTNPNNPGNALAPTNPGNSNDDMSADTATGDDDY